MADGVRGSDPGAARGRGPQAVGQGSPSAPAPLTLTTSQDLPPAVIAAYNRAGIQVRRIEPGREWWLCPECWRAYVGTAARPVRHLNWGGYPCSAVMVRVREVIDGG